MKSKVVLKCITAVVAICTAAMGLVTVMMKTR